MFKRTLCSGLTLGVAAGFAASVGQAEDTPTHPAAPFAVANEARIVIPIDTARSITLRRVNVTRSEQGTTWDGLVEDTGESAMLMEWQDGHFGGAVSYRGNIYAVSGSGRELHAALERDAKKARDHAVRSQASADAFWRRMRANAKSKLASQQRIPFSDAHRKALEAKNVTIDLMVLYTRNAANHYVLPMEDLITRTVEETNRSFRNSGLENISLRLVHTQAIDYEDAIGEHFEHLYRMVDGVGALNNVHRLRDEKRADIVGLIVDDPSGCGLSTRVAPDTEEAYFVVHHSCAALTLSLAHEIGHILGARHERGSDQNEAPFPYGHGHVNGTKWRDIMSYRHSCDGCRRILYWSNPRISYEGEPTGTEDDDNARVILEQAERVANFR